GLDLLLRGLALGSQPDDPSGGLQRGRARRRAIPWRNRSPLNRPRPRAWARSPSIATAWRRERLGSSLALWVRGEPVESVRDSRREWGVGRVPRAGFDDYWNLQVGGIVRRRVA